MNDKSENCPVKYIYPAVIKKLDLKTSFVCEQNINSKATLIRNKEDNKIEYYW